jgi:DNA replicative helicase MCM subunit Mcm2 (Cdc46/Mcm family)
VIVELADVAAFDTELLTSLQKRPDFQLRLFEAAARDVLQRSVLPSIERHHAFDVQLALQSTQLSTPLRSLTAEHVGRLLKVSGIIVSACLRVVGECFRTLEGLARASKQQQRIARIATL